MSDIPPWEDAEAAMESLGVHTFLSEKANKSDWVGLERAVYALPERQLRNLMFGMFMAAGIAHQSGSLVFDEDGYRAACEAEIDRLG